jgi:glycosyltransferase involved in cell wall biosynthesis
MSSSTVCAESQPESTVSEIRPLVLISALPTAGAERVTVSFVRRLWAMGLRVPLCTVTARHDGPMAGELSQDGIQRYDLGARRLADPRAPLRLARLLRRERVQLVHAHGQDASIVAAAACAFSGASLVVTRHVLDEPSVGWRQRLRARAACAAMRRADAVVAVSRAVAGRVADLARIQPGAIEVIPNGVDLERFDRPGRECRAAVLEPLAIDTATPIVLVPAALREEKGHEVLLEALPELLRAVPSVQVLIVGGGEREQELRARARPLGETVRFLGPRDDMPDLMAACDVVVLPSRAEALPTALMEAAAAGRPVVATRVGGVPEVVEDGRTGLLVPAGDPHALARALASVLADPVRAAALGDAARARARQRFGIDRQVQRTIELWTRVVAGRG